MTEEELLQFLEDRQGRGVLGNLNWILFAVGGTITVVGAISSPGREKIGFKMDY